MMEVIAQLLKDDQMIKEQNIDAIYIVGNMLVTETIYHRKKVHTAYSNYEKHGKV